MNVYRGKRRALWRDLLSSLLTLILIYGSVPAQSGSSSVRGTILDPQGRAVTGATVTLTSTDTRSTRTQTTTDAGVFVFDLIQPGAYELTVEAKGFKKKVVTGIRALVANPVTFDTLVLDIGEVTESVTISGGASEIPLNKTDATLGNNFGSKQIEQLPLDSRNIVALLSLQPGVTPDGSVTGSRADQANVTLDGVDVNEQQTGLDPLAGTAFSSVLRVTPESIQEFRVTTINPTAAQGRSAGAQVSLITKSGTNDFHGSLYEFHRNTVLNANTFFNNRSGVERPDLIRNVFGGAIGGPIKKDRLFFFNTYEGRRDARQFSVVRTVPQASIGRGEVRYRNTSGGITTLTAADINRLFPAVGVNPAALAVLADAARKYPANDTGAGDGLNTGGFRFNASAPVSLNANILKLDYNATADGRHILFFRGNYQQDVFTNASQFPDTPSPQFWSHPWGIAAGHTWTINSTLVNNFRYGLTREAFTSGGDSDENFESFRFVFQPSAFARTLGRVTPVHNITDDVSWIKGDHNFQFGTNIRLISNRRHTFGNSFDSAIANPSFYAASGAVLSRPVPNIAPGSTSAVQNAVSAVIGRFSQFSVNLNYDESGNLLPAGTGVRRNFKTQEGDFYFQDVWKLNQSLTLTLGLRYGLSRPIYETNGLQTLPSVSLGEYFDRRREAAAAGQLFNDLITVDLAGPANDRPGYYPLDKNNFQPRLAFAWSPNFETGILRKLFGNNGDSVFRGGFSITNDFIGQQLAVQFDLGADLGFATSHTVSANTFNVTSNPAPPFIRFGQNIRILPIVRDRIDPTLVFPLTQPADEAQRIEQSFDNTIVSPINYSWSFSFGRKLPGGAFVEASYIGRKARNLLITRDIMHLNNFTDSRSGIDWYTAAGQLNELRSANTELDRLPRLPYFENLFPGLGDFIFGDPTLTATQAAYLLVARDAVGGFNILDWTTVQLILDDASPLGPNLFFQPQYAALAAFSTRGQSDYHAGTLSVRQRYKNSLTFDFNYTFSKSFDNASGLQSSGAYGGAFLVNPLDERASRSVSDFDLKHLINANAVWQFPIGRGHRFLNDAPGFVEALVGGWQLTSIFRWDSGLPAPSPFDAAQWATNWNVQSNGARIAPVKTSPTRGGATEPNLFADPTAVYRSFRNARAGEVGDRNQLRFQGFIGLDVGLGKTFTMPWNENHKLQFRWEAFNVTNTQRFTVAAVTRENFGLDIDPDIGTPNSLFGVLDAIQGDRRIMQFGLRFTF